MGHQNCIALVLVEFVCSKVGLGFGVLRRSFAFGKSALDQISKCHLQSQSDLYRASPKTVCLRKSPGAHKAALPGRFGGRLFRSVIWLEFGNQQEQTQTGGHANSGNHPLPGADYRRTIDLCFRLRYVFGHGFPIHIANSNQPKYWSLKSEREEPGSGIESRN